MTRALTRKTALRLSSALLATVVFLLVAEIGSFAILAIWPDLIPKRPRAPRSVLISRDEHHEREKPRFRQRIVCIGDSCTYGLGVKAREAWPARLEELLNRNRGYRAYEVINLGLSGQSSQDGLARLRQAALKFEPDLVIASFGHNDKWRSVISDREKARRAGTLLYRGSVGLSRFLRRSSLFELLQAMLAPFQASFRSRFGRMEVRYRVPLHQYRENLAALAWESERSGSKIAFLDLVENPAMAALTKLGAAAYLEGDAAEAFRLLQRLSKIPGVYQPRPFHFLALAAARLDREKLAAAAAEKARRFAHVFPYFRELDLPPGRIRVVGHLDGRILGREDWFDIHSRYREAMRQVAKELEIPLVDAWDAGLEAADFYDYCHPVAMGHEKLARLLAPVIRKLLHHGKLVTVPR